MKINNSGTTLVEVMISMVIILVLVVGGAAFIYYASRDIGFERNRVVALQVANSRLEELRADLYAKIIPQDLDGNLYYNYNLYYINYDVNNKKWVFNSIDPNDTVSINKLSNLPITTTVQYVDVEPADAIVSYDYVHVTVSVAYRLGSSDIVKLETYIGP